MEQYATKIGVIFHWFLVGVRVKNTVNSNHLKSDILPY